MKILLAGGYDTQNLGDHGSLAVFQRDLRKLESSTEIVILSRHPNSHFDKIYNVRSIRNLDHKNKIESIGRWFNGLNPGDDTSHLKKIWEELASSDLLVIGNGRLFVDITLDFMRGPLPYFALLVTLAKFLGVPIMLFSMTIVPVRSEIAQTLIKYIASNATIVTVREEASKRELLKLGINSDIIKVIPDAAFGLDFKDRKQTGMEILTKEKINTDNNKFIGINFKYTNLYSSINETYFHILAKFCDELYQNSKKDILLIPQMTYGIDNPLNDDRELYKIIHKKCKNKEHIHIINGQYNVFDTLAIYQMCEIVYSMRRHGIIFAATQHIPVFGLSGEKNTSYIMQELKLSEYKVNIYNINNNDIDYAIKAYYKRKKIANNLYKLIPQLKKETFKYAEIALSNIKK